MASTQSQALQDLINQLKTQTYTPKTEEELRKQAEGEYQSYYDQLRLAAQQQQETTDLALQQQHAGLKYAYDKQREASRKQYAAAYSQADRHALSRGMQRSSYNAQTLANISLEGAEAQQAIHEQQATAEGNIDEQRTLLVRQLAAQISQYSASQAADVLNRMRQLEDQEYDRGTAAQQYNNTLSQQIYQMIYQEQRDTIADQQWQQEFEESVRQFDISIAAGGGGGGGRSGGGGGKSSKNDDKSGVSLDDFMALLSPGTTTPAYNIGQGIAAAAAASNNDKKKPAPSNAGKGKTGISAY